MSAFSKNETVLVTGASGNIASLLLPELKKQGARVRALVHNAEKARQLAGTGIEAFVGDFENPETLDKAMAGVCTVFLLTPANLRRMSGMPMPSPPPAKRANRISCAFR